MKLNNKRGVSEVITAVLLILLVIAAIAIIWAVVINFIGDTSSNIEGQADCITTTLELSEVKYNSTSDALSARVKRTGTEGTVSSLKFLVEGTTANMTGTIPQVGETQTWTLASYPNPNPTAGQELAIATVIGTRTCPEIDSETIAIVS